MKRIGPLSGKRRTVLRALLGVSALSAGATMLWPGHERLHRLTDAALCFGTTVSITVLHEDAQRARAALADALTALREVDALFSLFRPDSAVSQLNRDGVLHAPDARLVQVLRAAQEIAHDTHGAFDVTVQPLWMAASRQEDPQALLPRVDYRQLVVSDDRITLGRGMAITLNGIAQGYGADLALAALQRQGVQQALLDTGEFATLGRRDDGSAWQLGIRDPRDANALAAVLAADGRCVATSGDYASTFSPDFSSHHIIDPHTGASPAELASVTVLAPTGLMADAISTACMVLGTQAARAALSQWPGVDVLCIGKDGQRWQSEGFPHAVPA